MNFLSVIVPTYNSEKTIERCLNSLVSQAHQDFEICIIDGGSIDKTIEKIIDFRSHFKDIRIISEPDKGAYDAMNKGVDIAKGEWLYFLGSDDEISDKDVFSDVFKESFSRKIGVVYGNVYVQDDTSWANTGELYDGEFDVNKLLSKNICHQAIFYRRELFQKFGTYKTRYFICADWDLNLRFFSKTKFVYLDRTIATFYGGGLSSKAPINPDPISESIEKFKRQALVNHRVRRLISLFGFS